MTIGINLLYLLPSIVGGTETYAAGLLRGLASVAREHRFVLFLNQESSGWPVPDGLKCKRVVCPVQAVRRGNRYAFEQSRLPGLLREAGIDILHSLGYNAPLFPGRPSVVTIPDLNFRAYDMPWMRRSVLDFFVRQSARRANAVIAISEFTRSEIIRVFGLKPEKVTAIHLAGQGAPQASGAALEATAVPLPGLTGKPYILAFSSVTPNKNIPNLLRACARLRERGDLPFRLVLVGHLLPGGILETHIKELRLDGEVLFTGYVERPQLNTLLRGARMLVFPSYYEGFGLPILEAMEMGLPVVCSNRGSLPEVAAGAACYFDPFSVDSMAATILHVVQDEALLASLRERGRENLRRFSWEATARKTLDVYHHVLGGAVKGTISHSS
ncbi:MAG: hypothetical protein H6Q30_1413 [Bacteroidetes bacterium]|jgi:glycosyltransferase involved in cell wall biosynthesis|nr:hypothetical protein [Bacteroidota bacterium]